MAVKIETTHTVSFEGSPKWHIKAEQVKHVDGSSFVKVRPYDEAFCRCVVHGCLDLPKRSRPSLAQCPGWKALLKCRNDAVAEQMKSLEPEHEAASLFGNDTRASKKSAPRLNAAQLQELRDNPEVMEFVIDGAGGRPPLNVSTIKPAHPCDDMYIPLDSDSIHDPRDPATSRARHRHVGRMGTGVGGSHGQAFEGCRAAAHAAHAIAMSLRSSVEGHVAGGDR